MDKQLPQNYNELLTSYISLQSRYNELEELIRHLQRGRFSAKSESMLHPGMKSLFEDEEKVDEQDKEDQKEIEVKPHKRKVTRKPLPENLPREEVYLDLSEEEKTCPCCKELMSKTHEKHSEKLHIIPMQYIVKKFILPVYGCKACETIKQAKMPNHPIPKCSVTSETIAHVAVAKYIDGMPLYRQEKAFGRYHVDISRDQMSRWMISIGEKLEPLKNRLHEKLLNSGSFGMDETRLQVLKEKDRRPDQKSFMLVQAREGPLGQSITLFHYEKSRSSETVGQYLRGFQGALNTDGLAVYDSYCRDRTITHGGCWAHARRPFADAVKGKKKNASIGKNALDLIKELFKIEKDLKGSSLEEIFLTRQQQSKIVVSKINDLWVSKIDTIPAKSLTGKALHYLKNQWDILTRFLEDPRLLLHNNFVEQQVRPLAVGRKNWLFCDSVAGANSSAVLFSLLNTAKVNGINPYTYLCEVLTKISHTDDLDSLLPLK